MQHSFILKTFIIFIMMTCMGRHGWAQTDEPPKETIQELTAMEQLFRIAQEINARNAQRNKTISYNYLFNVVEMDIVADDIPPQELIQESIQEPVPKIIQESSAQNNERVTPSAPISDKNQRGPTDNTKFVTSYDC